MWSGQCCNGDGGWQGEKDKYKEKGNVIFHAIKTSTMRIKGKT